MFPIIYINTVWFQFLYRINAAFGVSKAFVPYRLPYDTVAGRAKSINDLHATAIYSGDSDRTVTLNLPSETYALFCMTREQGFSGLSIVTVLNANRYGGIDTSTQTYGLIVNNNVVTLKIKAYSQALLFWTKQIDITWT